MKRQLLLYFILLFAAPFACAQKKFPCDSIITLFNKYYSIGDYASALPLWRDAFKNCPSAPENFYVNGEGLYEKLIAAENNEIRRSLFADSLLLIYDRQIEYYRDNGVISGKKGMALYRFVPSRKNEAVALLGTCVIKMGEKTPPEILFYCFQGNSQFYNDRKITADSLAKVFYKVSSVFDMNRGNPAYDDFSHKTDALFSVLFSCEMIEKIYREKIQLSPDSVALMNETVLLCYKRKCTTSQFYDSVAQKLFRQGPTPLSSRCMAQISAAKGNPEKAAGYYNDAVEMENDNVRKAVLMMDAAEFQFGDQKSFPQARTWALRAASMNPTWGKPWMFIGDLYFNSAGSCEPELKGIPVYWAAADKYLKAKTVDPAILQNADEKIKACEAHYPENKDITSLKLQPGSSYTIKCWIGENTTIRTRK